MIEEQAQVVRVESGEVWVETQRKSSCGSCAANRGCGTAVLSKVLGNRTTPIRVICDVPVGVGDQVVIAIREEALVRGSLAVYMVPLLGVLLGAMLGEWMAPQLGTAVEMSTIVGGITGMLIGLFWLRLFSRKIGSSPLYQPVVVKRVETLNQI
ncbi:Fis family transcriptional regulator [Solemya pervernicosa gill symbiont]|uniref:Fis family transcriptional regulator n=2 Tax=Gammaproteobacteria incertae sedis TaxID=118884 RepID=A0A1T2LAF1_9GAMM|nr:SoxR reducing system RseC family protein [Candidatus Reidiella endopervernicosa]OOZ42024.1 Fis family transcriptional regulator [Solemya pervernicosa gill symbiont]QKQ27034.1 SoxR reducing system RseC family protein [Candidatus Reidiella endopervernicosa]